MSRQQVTEMIRFVVAGIAATATDLGMYYVLCRGLPYSLSKGLSFICGGVVAYALNKYWTFQRARPSSTEASRFVLFNLFALSLNVLTNHGMLSVWPGAVLLALLMATTVTGVVSYVGFKWWVFRKPEVVAR